jgi:opacity protein-like surface antigen
MKRFALPTVLAAVAALSVTSPAGAQYVFFGGGPTFPSGDFKNVTDAKTGYTFMAGFGVDIGTSGVFIEAEIGRGSNSHANTGNFKEKTNVITAFGALGYSFGAPEKKVRPYLLAGAGLVANQFRTDAGPPRSDLEGTESNFGATGAGGLSIKLNEKASVWLEGRYVGSSGTNFLAGLFGITINFGN